jgi:tyrosyl-tRNA synthetase
LSPNQHHTVDNLSIDEQVALIQRGTSEIISDAELRRKLETAQEEKRPLRVKLGLDPTAPDIHLGIAVVLRKLRLFQDLGHEVTIIIGDFTATIGDPSGKSKTRPQLTAEEVQANAKTYQDQYCQILDPDKTRIVFNSQWLNQMNFSDVIKLSAQTTVARILERDDFANRFAANTPIGIHEILYPICQGYDSVVLKSDIEMGGTDQKFNNLMGRDLQRADGQDPQVVLLMPLLVGLDGTDKMSKSLGNYVGIYEPANEMFAKLMSIPDELMETYFELTTDVPMDEVAQLQRDLVDGSVHPKTIKQRLAREVVTIYHGETVATSAQAEFDRIHRHRQLPSEIPSVSISNEDLTDGKIWVGHLLTQAGFAKSTSEARRLVQQGGVRFDGEKVVDPATLIQLQDDLILQVGKRRFAQIKIG